MNSCKLSGILIIVSLIVYGCNNGSGANVSNNVVSTNSQIQKNQDSKNWLIDLNKFINFKEASVSRWSFHSGNPSYINDKNNDPRGIFITIGSFVGKEILNWILSPEDNMEETNKKLELMNNKLNDILKTIIAQGVNSTDNATAIMNRLDSLTNNMYELHYDAQLTSILRINDAIVNKYRSLYSEFHIFPMQQNVQQELSIFNKVEHLCNGSLGCSTSPDLVGYVTRRDLIKLNNEFTNTVIGAGENDIPNVWININSIKNRILEDRVSLQNLPLRAAALDKIHRRLELQFRNAVNQLYFIHILHLAVAYTNKELFIAQNGQINSFLPTTLNNYSDFVNGRISAEEGFYRDVKEARIYYNGILQERISKIFGGQKAARDGGRFSLDDYGRIRLSNDAEKGLLNSSPSEITDLINRGFQEKLLNEDVAKNCLLISLNMPKTVNKDAEIGLLNAVCANAATRKFDFYINMPIPYAVIADNYRHIAFKDISYSTSPSTSKIAPRIIDEKVFNTKAMFDQSNIPEDSNTISGIHFSIDGKPQYNYHPSLISWDSIRVRFNETRINVNDSVKALNGYSDSVGSDFAGWKVQTSHQYLNNNVIIHPARSFDGAWEGDKACAHAVGGTCDTGDNAHIAGRTSAYYVLDNHGELATLYYKVAYLPFRGVDSWKRLSNTSTDIGGHGDDGNRFFQTVDIVYPRIDGYKPMSRFKLTKINNTTANVSFVDNVPPAPDTPDVIQQVTLYNDSLFNRVADVSNSSHEDGAKIQLWANNGTLAQKWDIVRIQGNDIYKIVNKGSGKVMAAVTGGFVEQHTSYQNTLNQQWRIERQADGTIKFKSLANDFYLDIQSCIDPNHGYGGARLVTKSNGGSCNGKESHKWRIGN